MRFISLLAFSLIGFAISPTIYAQAKKPQIVENTGVYCEGMTVKCRAYFRFGGDQIVATGSHPHDLRLQVIDAVGRPVTNQKVSFTLLDATGEATTHQFNPNIAITNRRGYVTTNLLNPLDTVGLYQIHAQIPNSQTVETTYLKVIDVNYIPQLGKLYAVNLRNGNLDELVGFARGGILQGEYATNPTQVKVNTPISIIGEIQIPSEHVGKSADLLVVAAYAADRSRRVDYFMMIYDDDYQMQILNWNGAMSLLRHMDASEKLHKRMTLNIFNGRLLATGTLQLFLGYRLQDGTIVFNGELPIQINITR